MHFATSIATLVDVASATGVHRYLMTALQDINFGRQLQVELVL